MSHTSHGTIISMGDGPGGLLDSNGALLLDEMSTIAITGLDGRPVEHGTLVALELAGRVIHNEGDTVNAVYLLSILDAGRIAGHLFEAVRRTADVDAIREFAAGVLVGESEVRER